MKKGLWTVLIVSLFLVGLAGGIVYWTFVKTKTVANSALDAAKNAQSVTTPKPSPSISVSPTNLSLPSADVAGEDLADVPRYAGSIRTAYDKNDDSSEINIEYIVSASAKDILNFYKEKLPANSWILFAEDPQSLTFSKSQSDASVEIVESSNNLIQYRIHFFRTQE